MQEIITEAALSSAQKKYLYAIYSLCRSGTAVRSAEVSRLIGVSKASTVAMTKRLCDIGYIEKEHYGQIILTENGARAAAAIYTRCIIVRDFLKNRLDINDITSESDALEIVAHISDDTAERLIDFVLEGKE